MSSSAITFDCVRIVVTRRKDGETKYIPGFHIRDQFGRCVVITALHSLGWRSDGFIIENHQHISRYYSDAKFHTMMSGGNKDGVQNDGGEEPLLLRCWPPLVPPSHIDTGYRIHGDSSRGDLAVFSVPNNNDKKNVPRFCDSLAASDAKSLSAGSVVHMVTIDKWTHERMEYSCTVTQFDSHNCLWKTKLNRLKVSPARYSGSPVFDSQKKLILGIAVQGIDAPHENEPAEMYFAPIEDVRAFLDLCKEKT